MTFGERSIGSKRRGVTLVMTSPHQAEREIEKERFTIGRSEQNDWVLSDDSTVSRSHCVIEYRDGRYWVTDTSTSGLMINGSILGRGKSRVLNDVDRLSVGVHVIEFRIRSSFPEAISDVDSETSQGRESADEFLKRVRSPRVEIEFDVESGPGEGIWKSLLVNKIESHNRTQDAVERSFESIIKQTRTQSQDEGIYQKGVKNLLSHIYGRLQYRDDRKELSRADTLDCTVFAPPKVRVGESFMVQVFVYEPEKSEFVEAVAKEFDLRAERRGAKCLEALVEEGETLTFNLIIPGLDVDEPVGSILWQGRIDCEQFRVDVSSDFKIASVVGKLIVSKNTIPIGCIKFLIEVTENKEVQPPRNLGDDSIYYRKCFISYASEDRNEVIKRTQMLEVMNIEFFQDVLSLKPGDRWERGIYRKIDECDLFLLFWSKSAKESKWVMSEVRYALDRKGGEEFAAPEIIPVIIEGPPIVPPPPELEEVHFDDRMIYFVV